MKKSLRDNELPSHLQELTNSRTFGEAEKQIKDISEVLKKLNELIKDKTIEKVKELRSNGTSQRQIASELRISISTVRRYLKK
jgi:DNA-binding NarL/FixJ family response regulator